MKRKTNWMRLLIVVVIIVVIFVLAVFFKLLSMASS